MVKTVEEAATAWIAERYERKEWSMIHCSKCNAPDLQDEDIEAAYAAGAAHGQAEEREAVLAIIAAVEADGDIEWADENDEIVARIRQRGKK